MSTIRTTLSGLNSRAVDTGRPKSKKHFSSAQVRTRPLRHNIRRCKSRYVQESNKRVDEKREEKRCWNSRPPVFARCRADFHGHTIFPGGVPLCSFTSLLIFFSVFYARLLSFLPPKNQDAPSVSASTSLAAWSPSPRLNGTWSSMARGFNNPSWPCKTAAPIVCRFCICFLLPFLLRYGRLTMW